MMSTFPHTKRHNTLKTVLIWGLLMVPASALLYSTSSHVRELEREQAQLNQTIAAEKESLRVMQAEWAYLNNPARLAAKSKTWLGFKAATSPKQIAAMGDMSVKVALRDQGSVTIQTAQAEPAPLSTPVLAKPIGYSHTLIDSLPDTGNVKLPAAATWEEKIVSAAPDLMPKSRSMP